MGNWAMQFGGITTAGGSLRGPLDVDDGGELNLNGTGRMNNKANPYIHSWKATNQVFGTSTTQQFLIDTKDSVTNKNLVLDLTYNDLTASSNFDGLVEVVFTACVILAGTGNVTLRIIEDITNVSNVTIDDTMTYPYFITVKHSFHVGQLAKPIWFEVANASDDDFTIMGGKNFNNIIMRAI